MRRRFVGAAHITVRSIRANQNITEEVVRGYEGATIRQAHENAVFCNGATEEGLAGEGTENHDDTPEVADRRAHMRYNGR